jgi:antitoxin YefM
MRTISVPKGRPECSSRLPLKSTGAAPPYRQYLGGRRARHGLPVRLSGMTIIVVMSETLPLAEIKAHLSEIVDRVEREHERVILTRNGRPAAVILSPGDLEALEDTLELLSDPQALTEIQAARDDLAHGRVVTGEELRSKYLHR